MCVCVCVCHWNDIVTHKPIYYSLLRYPLITPHGDQCVVGGGKPSDWCYPCTNYYYPNKTDTTAQTVHALADKVRVNRLIGYI